MTIKVDSCASVQLNKSRNASNPMLPRYGVGFGAAGPSRFGTASAITTDGVLGYASQTATITAPSVFSMAIWFKTSVSGGGMMGFFAQPVHATTPVNADRFFYLDSSGALIFSMVGSSANSTFALKSANNKSDNVWHFAVATVASAGGSNVLRTLYVDGASVASSTIPDPVAYTGYWHIGANANKTNSFSGAVSDYFSGSLSNAATWPTAISAAQVSQLYAATSQSAYDLVVASTGANNSWALNDDGQTTFAGPYPYLAAALPCDGISASITNGGVCITSGCSMVPLTALNSPQPIAANTTNVAISLGRNGSYNPFSLGLQLIAPISIRTQGFAQTFVWANTRSIE